MSETLSKSLFTPDSSLVQGHHPVHDGILVRNPSLRLVPPTSQPHVRVSSSIAHRSRRCPSLSRTRLRRHGSDTPSRGSEQRDQRAHRLLERRLVLGNDQQRLARWKLMRKLRPLWLEGQQRGGNEHQVVLRGTARSAGPGRSRVTRDVPAHNAVASCTFCTLTFASCT